MKKMRMILGMLVIALLLVCSVSFTSYAYTEEEKAQAKAWLSAHGYSPDWGGANQAYQDYLNGKFDEELGVDVNGDGIPATTQAGDQAATSETKTEAATEDKTEDETEERTEESTKTEDEAVKKDTDGTASKDANAQEESNSETAEHAKGESEEEKEEADSVSEEEDAAEAGDADVLQDTEESTFHIEGYQVVMIVIIVIFAVVLLFFILKQKKNRARLRNDKGNL